MDSPLPAVKITTVPFFADEQCVLCGRPWDNDYPVPTAYTEQSLAAEALPAPVCDHCVEAKYGEPLFSDLLTDRRRFYAN